MTDDPKPKTDTRGQDIRLTCLQAAVQGSGSAMSTSAIIDKAAQFEAFVLKAERGRPGQQSAWVGDS